MDSVGGGTSESSWSPGRRMPVDEEKDLTVTSRIFPLWT